MKLLFLFFSLPFFASAHNRPQVTYDFQKAEKLYVLETMSLADSPGLVMSSYKTPAQAVVFCGPPDHGLPSAGVHFFSSESLKRQLFFRVYDLDLGDMGEFASDVFASPETCRAALNELLVTPQVSVRFDLESRKLKFDRIQAPASSLSKPVRELVLPER